MPDAIYSQTLHDTLHINEELLAKIRANLEKHQGTFLVSREDLTAMGQQLMTLEYLATQSMENLEALFTGLRDAAAAKKAE